MTRYHLTLRSDNKKTGPIPVSTTSADTCPPKCGQFKTCYAKGGPLLIHWRRMSRSGLTFPRFLKAVRALPEGSFWRHNQAGDLPGEGARIDAAKLRLLAEANKGRRGFTFTHKPLSARNADAVLGANLAGFTINLSADTLKEADEKKARGIAPVVVVVPEDVRRGFRTPAGNLVVICPAVTHGVTCKDCRLCAWAEREVIIGFPAHGFARGKIKSDFVQIGGIA